MKKMSYTLSDGKVLRYNFFKDKYALATIATSIIVTTAICIMHKNSYLNGIIDADVYLNWHE